ncbi:hypothetical protein [Streptomyces sp. NPDC058657]|uniref:hypothetical protein n=1 Tax=unclassified Streptomyces TaxID=2593676 RepID=UPI0036671DBB
MNVDDLVWQTTWYGGVHPEVVDSLLEHGHLELVEQAAAERGDWYCARGAVTALQEKGLFERAWAVMKPFAKTGWLPAVAAGADVLLAGGRVEEALTLAYPTGEKPAVKACEIYAETLVKCGRVDDAISFLEPHLREPWALRALVAMTEDQGRDVRVLDLVVPIADEARHHQQAQGRSHPAWDALDLQAEVLERSGRVEEAIRVLGEDVAAHRYGPLNTVVTYTWLLARHGRTEELRQAATGDHAREAFRPLTSALIAAGRAGEAETLLREHLATAQYPQEWMLMEFLAAQGRFEEAIDIGLPTFEDPWESPLQGIVILLAGNGHHARALQLLNECSAQYVAEAGDWVPSNRWWLMGELGRCREAIAEINATPEMDTEERICTVASLMAKDGRLDDAIALLATHPHGNALTDRAKLLACQNRPTEALDVLPGVTAQRAEHEQRREGLRTSWGDTAASDGEGAEKRSQGAHRDGCAEDPPF